MALANHVHLVVVELDVVDAPEDLHHHLPVRSRVERLPHVREGPVGHVLVDDVAVVHRGANQRVDVMWEAPNPNASNATVLLVEPALTTSLLVLLGAQLRGRASRRSRRR